MKKIILIIFLVLTVSTYGYIDLFSEYGLISDRNYVNEKVNMTPIIYFSSNTNLTEIMLEYFLNSNEIKCAFYDLKSDIIKNELLKKDAIVVIEDDNEHDEFLSKYSYGKMHNKFCLLDNNLIITGSANPTKRGYEKNNNNIIVLQSKYLTKNYLDEFEELYNGIHGKGKHVESKNVLLNDHIDIQNLFCPEDFCKKTVLKELDKSKNSIYFMTFSFTDKDIADKLIQKNNNNITVFGLVEKNRKNMRYEKYNYLIESGVNVITDKNKYNMHHKVFIIDNEIVIAGSYNPSKSGDESNDENIVIIKDEAIARQYLDEFDRLTN